MSSAACWAAQKKKELVKNIFFWSELHTPSFIHAQKKTKKRYLCESKNDQIKIEEEKKKPEKVSSKYIHIHITFIPLNLFSI